MIDPFTILASISTKPGDLVDLLYRRSGHAFVPVTQSPFMVDFEKARRDEVTLANFAANRWGLRIPTKGGLARGAAVPIGDLFVGGIRVRKGSGTRPGLPKPPSPETRWARAGGRLTTVGDLLRAGGLDPERSHWTLRNRKVLVRFDPATLASSLPDLALAVGGRPNADRTGLNFEPRAFRDHVRDSIPEAALVGSAQSELELGLLRTAILHATDTELTTLFASPDGTAEIRLESLSPNEQECARRYSAASLAIIDRGADGQGGYLRSMIDFARPPSLLISTRGQARLIFIGRDGKTKIDF